VTHGLPVYRSTVPAYLLHHTRFVSVYSEQLRQPMWTAAHINEVVLGIILYVDSVEYNIAIMHPFVNPRILDPD